MEALKVGGEVIDEIIDIVIVAIVRDGRGKSGIKELSEDGGKERLDKFDVT